MADAPSQSTLETGFVEINGAALEVQRFGISDPGPTIVMLHEGLGSVAMWRDFPAQLAVATMCPVMVYARRGYGRSAPRAGAYGVDFMHREALDVLPALLEALGIVAPIMLGHSDGGSIALIHAAAYPVAGVAVMAPHIFVEDMVVTSITALRKSVDDGDFLDRLGRYHDNPEHAFWGWNDIWLEPAFRAWNITDEVARITVPVLAIQGETDEYGTMAQIDEIKARSAGPVRLLQLTDCGHAPHRDQPAKVLQALVAFANQIREAAG